MNQTLEEYENPLVYYVVYTYYEEGRQRFKAGEIRASRWIRRAEEIEHIRIQIMEMEDLSEKPTILNFMLLLRD